MALDDVLADPAGVARRQAGGNPKLTLNGVEFIIGNVIRFDFKAF